MMIVDAPVKTIVSEHTDPKQSLRITLFTIPQILQLWSTIGPILEKSADVSPDLTLEIIYKNLSTGAYQALVSSRINEANDNEICGVMVFKTIIQKDNKILFIVAIGGEYITRIDYFDTLKKMMKSNGIDKLQCWARPSAARLWKRLGIKTLYSVMEIDV